MLAGPPWAKDFEVPKNKPVPMVPVDPQGIGPFGKTLTRMGFTHQQLRSSGPALRTMPGGGAHALPMGLGPGMCARVSNQMMPRRYLSHGGRRF